MASHPTSYIYIYISISNPEIAREKALYPKSLGQSRKDSDFGISEVDFRNACINEWKAHNSSDKSILPGESTNLLLRFLLYIFCSLDTKVHCEESNRLKEQSILAKSC